MRFYIRIISVALALLVSACAKPPVITPPPTLVDRGEKVFERAEQLYKAGSFEAALKGYQTYLFNYPNRMFAPTALDRQAEIYFSLGNIAKAKDAYQRLVEDYPESPLVNDAGLGLIRCHVSEKNYPAALDRSTGVDVGNLSRSQTLEYFILLGTAYEKTAALEKAVNYFSLALELAAGSEKESARTALAAAVESLSPEAIQSLVETIDYPEAVGYLNFQLIRLLARQGELAEAMQGLDGFLESYPDHPQVPHAAQLKAELEEKLRPPEEKTPAYERYTVGCMLPMSGPFEIYGRRALRGIEMAVNEFNSNETNPSITVMVKDTASDADRALKVVEELNEAAVAAIIGPIRTAVPAAFAAQERKIPILVLTQRDDVAIIGDYVFRNFLTPRMQAASIATYITGRLGIKRVAILYPDEHYGKTYMNLFWDAIIAQDGSVVGVESYDPKGTDFADPIKKLVGLFYEVPKDLQPEPPPAMTEDPESKPNDEEPKAIVDFEAVFIPDAPKKAGLIIPQLLYYDIEDVYLLGTNLWHADKLIDMAGSYAQGAIISDGFFAKSKSENVKAFTDRFRNTYDVQPEFIEAIAYDNAMMLFSAISKPDIESREMLKADLLSTTDYPGITGATSFDENGDAVKHPYLLQIRKDRFVEINPGE